ncbi:exopolysaccharide biosynthesis protein [Inquilinus limosus]|uniref:exopolysaccharide biosynthesis protein n=1 Tax=Inquilinus limosus TaxID=171674 RepID=UPI003F5CFA15
MIRLGTAKPPHRPVTGGVEPGMSPGVEPVGYPAGEMTARVPTSALLDSLLRDADPKRVTLGWLVDRLGDRSFGLVMLLLALLGAMPGASAVVAPLLAILAVQMMLGHAGPVFPRRVAERSVQTEGLARTFGRAVPVLRTIEGFIHPRWPTPFEATKRGVGLVVLLLGVLLLAPIPLSNIPPALTIALLAIAYLEEDGIMLCIALAASGLLLAVAAGAVWQTMGELGWVQGFL